MERQKRQVKAQLYSSSGRSSKVLRDSTRIETVVEVPGAGRLVLRVGGEGGYSLRAYPEGGEATRRDVLAVGVIHAEGIVAVAPDELSATESEEESSRPSDAS